MERTVPQRWPYDTANRRAYWTAWVATLTFFAGFYTLLVPLPRYLAAVGLPDWQVGFVLGAFGVASLIGRPLAGMATDRWGARAVMLASAAALVLGAAGMPTTTDLAVLFGLRLFQAIGYVGFTTAGTALVVRLAPPPARGRQLAIFGAAANLAITLSPAAASLLLASFPLALGFILAAGLALGAGLLAAVIPSAPAHPGTPDAIDWTFPRQLWPSMLMAGLLGAGFAAFFQFAPILAERRGTVAAGTLYAVYGASIIAVRLAGGRAIDRLGLAAVLGVAIALVAAGLALAAVGVAAGSLMLAAVLIAAGSGLYHPALLAHHAALLPSAPGRASAAFYVGFDLGIGVGSWLFGLALQHIGVAGLYGLAATLALAAAPLVPLLARLRRSADS